MFLLREATGGCEQLIYLITEMPIIFDETSMDLGYVSVHQHGVIELLLTEP